MPPLVTKLSRCDRGDVFVEAAVALPIMIVIMAGLVDFGLAYSNLATAQKSLRNASRYLAVLPAEAVCGSAALGLQRAKKLAVYGKQDITSLDNPLIRGWTADDITLNPVTCQEWPDDPPEIVWLEADVKYRGLMWQVIGFSDSITLHASHQERWIGE